MITRISKESIQRFACLRYPPNRTFMERRECQEVASSALSISAKGGKEKVNSNRRTEQIIYYALKKSCKL